MKNTIPAHMFTVGVFVTGWLISPPVFALNTAQDGLEKCRQLTNDAARLVCYDTLADQQKKAMQTHTDAKNDMAKTTAQNSVKAALAKPAAPARAADNKTKPAPTASTAPAKSTSIEEAFGAEDVVSKREERAAKRIDELTVTVVKLSFTHRDKARFTLSNGQVWEQTDRMKARRFKLPYTAILKRASMGSYKINKEGSGVSTRIKRIK